MRRERDSPDVVIHQIVIVGDVREVCVDDGYGIVEYWKRGGEVACRDAGLWRGQYICKWARCVNWAHQDKDWVDGCET